MLSSVDLPHPVGPTTETNSPAPTCIVVFATAVYRSPLSRERNVTVMSSNSRADAMSAKLNALGFVFVFRPPRELVGVGLRQVDLVRVHVGLEARERTQRRARPVFGHQA